LEFCSGIAVLKYLKISIVLLPNYIHIMKIIFSSLIFLFLVNYAFAQSIQYSGKRNYRIPNNTYPHKTIKKSKEPQIEIKTPMQKNSTKTSKDLIVEGEPKKTSYNMPILSLESHESNMAIAKPDTTIVYTILKRP